MTCYGNNGLSTFDTSGKKSCISGPDFDKYCNYNSNTPFASLHGPPNNSKIKKYWSRGDVKAPLKCILTWSQYLSYQQMKVGSNLGTAKKDIKNGNGYTGKINAGTNNPGNLSYGDLTKSYGATKTKTVSDGVKLAVFPDMAHGLAAMMAYIVKKFNGLNVCQINNTYQGFYTQDESSMHDCIGFAALRLRWVTGVCNSIGIKPYVQLNLNDKETLFAVINGVAGRENGLTFQRGLLESAYKDLK